MQERDLDPPSQCDNCEGTTTSSTGLCYECTQDGKAEDYMDSLKSGMFDE